jgi:hypothetical protein
MRFTTGISFGHAVLTASCGCVTDQDTFGQL